MTATALLPGEQLSAAISLPNGLTAAAVAELTLALGRAPQPSDIAALFRRADRRSWLLAYHEPAVSRSELGADADQPWRHPIGMRFTTAYGPIAEVAPILLDPRSGHAECHRRETLHEQMQRDLHERQQAQLAEARRAGASQDEERRRVARAKEDFRWKDWGPLPTEAKLALALALAVDDGKDLATELRRLGGELAKTNTIPFPERRWW